jgi:hypothetical protein
VFGGFFRGEAGGVDGIEDAVPGELAVLRLAAGVLGGGALTGGAVLDGDGGGNFVDVLTTGAAAAVKGFGEILEAEAELLQPLRTRGLKIDGGLHRSILSIHPPKSLLKYWQPARCRVDAGVNGSALSATCQWEKRKRVL